MLSFITNRILSSLCELSNPNVPKLICKFPPTLSDTLIGSLSPLKVPKLYSEEPCAKHSDVHLPGMKNHNSIRLFIKSSTSNPAIAKYAVVLLPLVISVNVL